MRTIMFRLRGTVILKIWWQVILVCLYTAVVICIVKYGLGWEIDIVSNLKSELLKKESTVTTVGIFGLFTGFLLVFRTNTAYDRYWEGRKLWSTMTSNIRTLTRLIWTMVPVNKLGVPIDNVTYLEKVSTINLLIAYAYATRNYLRENHSYDEKDLKPFLKHIPKLSKGKKYEEIFELQPHRNIPIEISHLVLNYIRTCRQRDLIDDPTNTVINNVVNNLVECFGSFEKILRTPIPMAYSVHLHHAIWLYFLALPYQLIGILDWFTIPVVALAAFSMLGILRIGWEIESPFGDDDNDLPIDDFCKVIHQEVLDVIGHPMPTAESWILSKNNYPFMPESCLAAVELLRLSEPEIRIILKGYSHPIDCYCTSCTRY